MTVRIGIIGCGFIGTIHSMAIAQLVRAGLVDARVTATYDVDERRASELAARHDAVPRRSLDGLLADVDAVWVCTWTAAHRSAVEAAVDAGRAVFCEKPLAPNLAECEAVAGLLGRVPHQVGLVLRHAPVFEAAADVAASGRFGRPLLAVLRDDQYFPIQGMYDSEWRADVELAGGGTLLEHSIHDVDVLRWLMGEPGSVRATTASRFGHDGIDDVAEVTFGMPDGGLALLVSVWHQVLSRPSTRRLELFCEEAFCWTDDDYLGPLHVETTAGEESIAGEPPEWIDRFDLPDEFAIPLAQYAAPTKSFLDALATGTGQGWPDATTALAAHRLVDAAYKSAAANGQLRTAMP